MSLITTDRLTDNQIRIDPGTTRIAGEGAARERDYKVFLVNVKKGDETEAYALKAEEVTYNIKAQGVSTEELYQRNVAVMWALHEACENDFPKCRIVTDTKELDVVLASLTNSQKPRFTPIARPGECEGANIAIWMLMEAFPDWHDFGEDEEADTKRREAFARAAVSNLDFWKKLGVIAVLDMFLGNTDRFAPIIGKHEKPSICKESNIIFNGKGPIGLDFFSNYAERMNNLYSPATLDDDVYFKDWDGFFLKETLTASDLKCFMWKISTDFLKTPIRTRKTNFANKVVHQITSLCDYVPIDEAALEYAKHFISGMSQAQIKIGKWTGAGTSNEKCSPEAEALFNKIGGGRPAQLKIRYSAIWPGS